MALEPAEIKKIARLARLAIGGAEIPAYSRELSAILDLVTQMNSVDTQQVAPLAHPLEMAQRLRADEVTEGEQRERFQAGAPLAEDGLYLVPKVIE